MSKVISASEAAALIKDGATVGAILYKHTLLTCNDLGRQILPSRRGVTSARFNLERRCLLFQYVPIVAWQAVPTRARSA